MKINIALVIFILSSLDHLRKFGSTEMRTCKMEIWFSYIFSEDKKASSSKAAEDAHADRPEALHVSTSGFGQNAKGHKNGALEFFACILLTIGEVTVRGF